METFNNNKSKRHFGLGIFLLAIGSIFMLRNAGLGIPFWVLSWHTILLGVGIYLGFKKDFKAGNWIILVIIGGLFTLKDIVLFDLSHYTSALALIGIGLYLILKPKKQIEFCDFGHKKQYADFGEHVNKGK